MTYQIDSNIPFPTAKGHTPEAMEIRETLEAMQIGDSFTFKSSQLKRVQNGRDKYHRNFSRRYTVARDKYNDDMFRVWRTH